MKMIIAIVENTKKEAISEVLLASGYRVTQLATTSGFLRGGATTLMIGVEDARVENALQLIRDQFTETLNPDDVKATLYVLNVKNFNRL